MFVYIFQWFYSMSSTEFQEVFTKVPFSSQCQGAGNVTLVYDLILSNTGAH